MRAKIILIGIFAISILGGTIAAKVKTGTVLYYLTTTTNTTIKYCVGQDNYNTIQIGTTTTVNVSYYTTRVNPTSCNGLTYSIGQTAYYTVEG